MLKNESENDYIRVLDVLENNATADGYTTNSVQYSNFTASTLEPVSGETVLFQITKGGAKFTNGSTVLRTMTDSDGIATAQLTNTTPEVVTVKVTTSLVTNTPLTTDVTFVKGGALVINSITTEHGRIFAAGEPTIAWNGAKIKVITSGGSGSASWSVSGPGLALDETLTNGALFRFTSDTTTSTVYEIKVEDKVTGSSGSYSFTLADFYQSFGTNTLHEFVDQQRLPTPEQLLNLYGQWGPMSNYSGWTENTDVYWTNEGFLTLVTLVNLDTGELKKGSDIIGSHGYAELKK